jgi:hypothetical protein
MELVSPPKQSDPFPLSRALTSAREHICPKLDWTLKINGKVHLYVNFLAPFAVVLRVVHSENHVKLPLFEEYVI